MNAIELKASLTANQPPSSLSVYHQALWWEAKGNWDKAHTLIQDLPDRNAAWIHAYLHRVEGDQWNADYWYHKASKPSCNLSLEQEWEELVRGINN